MKMNDGATQPQAGDTVVFSSVPQLTLGHFLLWCFQREKRFRIHGQSMEPTLRDGQEVLIRMSDKKTFPEPGQLVLVRHPMRTDLTMVKRCFQLEDGKVDVRGDNPSASTDSRSFGLVPVELILGYVACTFP